MSNAKSNGTSDLNVIGKPFRKVDARAKCTGQTKFADDIFLPRMLVLTNRQNAVRNWKIFAGDNCDDPGKRQSFRQVNAPD